MPSKFSASLSLEASKGVEKLMSNGTNSLSLTPNFIVPPDMRPQLSEVSTCETIPLIDLSLLHAHDNTTGRAEIIRQISTASQDYGFFQIVNHGVSEELKESMLHVAKESFEMPIEERAKFYLEDPKKQTRVSTSFNINRDRVRVWRDYFRHPCYPLEDYIDSWPQKPENYREVAGKYSTEVRLLILKLLALLSEGLGVDPNYLNQKLGEKPNQVLLINYYPPCPNPDLTLGIAGHSDPNAITVLQQGEVGGLHVFKDGKWFAIEPVKNAFVVNIADQLEVISNGRFKSVLHRAVTNSMAARISIPMFYAPFVDAIIEPAEELVSEETLAIYRSYKFGYQQREVQKRGTPCNYEIHILSNFITNILWSLFGCINWACQ
ncbi:protein DMR6-LIKE OXYGENASE 1-like isoform X2 [Amborella trichopoda]|uniref:protein DMR6-LIKE OXYGENASE 1-like isoform X2 n=1 Tax=Amborella trichopoda TaxID=13333 RepID=UPI0009BD3657|nr:protein DMR6-LIKE OXYGENASE 1-like isoform X2 [Amborella trichopoda]|eukprot:XP_011625850.2 protein DMR6-LIKE OXYGENASE 1-like isoform X2 [Amborella trichopoda]